MRNEVALVDMDLIVYRIGFACDNWHYEYCGDIFSSQKELVSYLKSQFSDPEEQAERLKTAERKRDPETWADTQETVGGFVEDLVADFIDYKGFISGKSNFRYKIATILPYKGTRVAEKPFHYDAIRQYLVESYGAVISEGIESDDNLGLAQRENTVIISIDKDLDIVPGKHYNWERDLEYEVSDLDGYRNFFKQMLTGDKTDNILGLYGVGPKSTLLKRIEELEDIDEMIYYVREQYFARFGLYASKFLEENAKLLWILHNRPNPIVKDKYWE